MLLPKPMEVGEDEEEEDEDPRAELVQRLLEYQRYKEAAQELGRREILGRDVFVRPSEASGDEDAEEVFGEVSIFHLLDAFHRILSERRWQDEEALKVEMDRVSLADRIQEIADLVSRHPRGIPFEVLFPPGSSRRELILTFLALLEMIRLRMIRAHQAIPYGTIRIEGIPGEHKSSLNPDS
jgi:segregation and condensation protein A